MPKIVLRKKNFIKGFFKLKMDTFSRVGFLERAQKK